MCALLVFNMVCIIGHTYLPEVKTTGYKIGHAYGIGFVISERSVGSTDVVAMEFIPLKLKTLKLKTFKKSYSRIKESNSIV